MTKEDIRDEIEFALKQLAAALEILAEIPKLDPVAGGSWEEALGNTARMLGRAQGKADNAAMYLRLAIGGLDGCIADSTKRSPHGQRPQISEAGASASTEVHH